MPNRQQKVKTATWEKLLLSNSFIHHCPAWQFLFTHGVPSDTLWSQCWLDIGSRSETLSQYPANIGSTLFLLYHNIPVSLTSPRRLNGSLTFLGNRAWQKWIHKMFICGYRGENKSWEKNLFNYQRCNNSMSVTNMVATIFRFVFHVGDDNLFEKWLISYWISLENTTMGR